MSNEEESPGGLYESEGEETFITMSADAVDGFHRALENKNRIQTAKTLLFFDFISFPLPPGG
jgi:hypothetical protein